MTTYEEQKMCPQVVAVGVDVASRQTGQLRTKAVGGDGFAFCALAQGPSPHESAQTWAEGFVSSTGGVTPSDPSSTLTVAGTGAQPLYDSSSRVSGSSSSGQ